MNNWRLAIGCCGRSNFLFLGGPVTPNGDFLTNVASNGIHNLIYSIEGCDDFVDITVKEINAGEDMTICPNSRCF